MEEYKIGNAIVRVRGKVDRKRLEEATKIFLEKVDKQRREKEKEKEKEKQKEKEKEKEKEKQKEEPLS